MSRTHPERWWIAGIVIAAAFLAFLWAPSGRPNRNGLRSDRSEEGGPARSDVFARNSEPERSKEPAPDRPLEGEVSGVVVVPPSSDVQPTLQVKPDDGAVSAERPGAGDFRLSYEREPERSYALEVDAPGMRPVLVPLPEAVEDVGRIVLQPSLVYRGRLVRDGEPVAGVRVALFGREGMQFGRSIEASDAEGRFELRVTDTDFSTLTKGDGAYLTLSLGFAHPTLSFQAVAARVEGFWGEHVVELNPRPRAEFVLASGADDVPIRLERSFDRSREPRIAPVATFGRSRTRDGGRYRTPWPPDWNAAWVVTGATTDETRYFVTSADVREARGAITLQSKPTHRITLRTRIRRAPQPDAEVTIFIRWKAPEVRIGWLQGVTDAEGRLEFELGTIGTYDAGPVEILTAGVFYSHEGMPRSETFDLVRNNRGHRSTRRLDLELGKGTGDAELWFTCTDDAGRALTPTRIVCMARLEGGLDPMFGAGLRPVPPSMGRTAGMFRVGNLALPKEGSSSPAIGAVFLVDTAEQGQERFPVSRESWSKASSATAPLRFRFARKETETLEFLVVDHARAPVPRTWITIVPLDLRSNLRRLDATRASSDADGVVKVGGLDPDRDYQVFAHDLRSGRTAFVARLEPRNAPRTTVLVLEPVATFEATLRLDTRIFRDPKHIGAFLCSDPQGILPDVFCTIDDGRIVAQHPSGLAGYQLRISTYHQTRGLVTVTRPATEANGATVPFPE